MNEKNLNEKIYKRGDLIYVNLSPVIGSEQDGIRPAVIVQNDKGNKFSPTIIILPITSKNKNLLPTHIKINSNMYGLPKNSVILAEQIRTIDKKRIIKKIGKIDENVLILIKKALEANFSSRINIFELIDTLN